MLNRGGNIPLDTFAERSGRALYIDGVTDKATACQSLNRVITVADLIGLLEVHVWAEAEALPYLAVAAAGIKDLPEGFQLREISERPVGIVEEGLTWLSRDLMRDLAAVG